MKLFTLLSLLAAMSSPAIADLVSSKDAGKAHCSKMQADQALELSSSGAKKKPSSGIIGR